MSFHSVTLRWEISSPEVAYFVDQIVSRKYANAPGSYSSQWRVVLRADSNMFFLEVTTNTTSQKALAALSKEAESVLSSAQREYDLARALKQRLDHLDRAKRYRAATYLNIDLDSLLSELYDLDLPTVDFGGD